MKNQFIFRTLALVLFFGLISLEIFAQGTGKLVGKVTDKKTGETLIGLNVKIVGATRGATTDVEGRFTIAGLAAGKYSVQFTYVGYATKTISDVIVKAGGVTTLDAVMEEGGANQIQAVVVTITARQESVSGLYAQQKNAVSISSGVTADIIKRSPDRNTSEVLRRVSGASIQDGKFVVVRGLSDRYNVAMINNTVMPSTEPDRKAFSFDIIPSNLIDKVVINKTASPDLPGDFAGGLTQTITKDIPDNTYLGVAVSYGYNTQSTFKNFISTGRKGADFLGFDDGSRSIPDGFPKSRQQFNSASLANRIQYSSLFKNPFGTQVSSALPNQSYQLNWGKVSHFDNGGSFGSIVSLTYRNSQNISIGDRERYNGIETAYSYNDENYRYATSWGALANFSYKKGRNKFTLKNLYNQSFEDNHVERTGTDRDAGRLLYSGNTVNANGVLNSVLDGDHSIGKRNFKLNWNVNYSLINRTQPDLNNILYTENGDRFVLSDDFTRRFYSDMVENLYGGSASILFPFKLWENKSSLKVGASKQMRVRDFNARIFLYEPATPSSDQEKAYLPKEEIFNAENIGANGFALTEITNNNDSYEGETDLNAAFVMLDNQLGEKVRLVWGARLEDYYQNVKAKGNSGANVDYDQTFVDILPSFNLTYSVNEKANIRLSGSQTVSRPELRELAPFTFFNQEDNTQITGNPSLKRAKIANGDLRFEYYPTPGEALTASVFYKDFRNPIEQVAGSVGLAFGYANAYKAYNYGIEFDVRKKLSFISDNVFFRNLTASANVTLIKSEVDLNQPGQSKRRLQGQSPYLLNGGLQYTAPKSGVMVNLLYNKIGERIWRVGNPGSGTPDYYEKARDVIDIQLAKKIFRNKGELRFNIGDILNQSQAIYQNWEGGTTYSSSDVHFNRYKSGTSFTLGINYDLSFAN